MVKRAAIAGVLAAALAGCMRQPHKTPEGETPMMKKADAAVLDPSKMTEEDWKKKLTPEQYAICRRRGTERSGSGKYLHHKEPGTYVCVACGNPLFESKTKYDACGWPSFWDCVPGAVGLKSDGFAVEAVCAKCDSHLGHLFDDGPPPTGRRY